MTPQMRELLRQELLRQLADAAPLALTTAQLHVVACALGHRCTAKEVEAEVAYLCDKGLAAIPAKLLSPELRLWRATAAGRDEAAALGLA